MNKLVDDEVVMIRGKVSLSEDRENAIIVDDVARCRRFQKKASCICASQAPIA